jgi:hypothetical protein
MKTSRNTLRGTLSQLAVVAAALAPWAGAAQEAAPAIASAVLAEAAEGPATTAREVVAEALFACDALPPGGRDVNLSLALQRGEADPLTGETSVVAMSRLQLALALGDRVGFTVDAGVSTTGDLRLEAPGASLKVLLRDPAAGTGLAASLDLYGATHSLVETEAGVGLGAIRAVGPVTLRASASAATGISEWTPHLNAGVSAAAALGARWRVLAEAVTELSDGRAFFSAGPTVKVALGERTALMAGALLPVSAGAAPPMVTLQLTQSL